MTGRLEGGDQIQSSVRGSSEINKQRNVNRGKRGKDRYEHAAVVCSAQNAPSAWM